MLRVAAFVVGVCLSAPAVARAQISADQTPAEAEMEARFDLLVKTGNQARLAGRHRDAATAYKAALDIHPHPVVSGRLGLALLKLGQIDRAGNELHLAMEHGQGVPLHERSEITAAYDKAKAATTWVSVTISQVGATVTCDGEPWNREGISAFWRFAMPGEHTIRAKLDGYQEAVETFTAKPGEKIPISLKLVPLPLPDLPKPQSEDDEVRRKRKHPPYLHTSNVWGAPDYSAKEDPTYGEPKVTKPVPKKEGPRFSVNGGVVTVFGVASWNPAVGGVVGVGLRPHENVSFGLEGRAAWLTTPVADREAISAMTAGGLLSACGHLKWFFGCGLGYVGTVNVSASRETYEEDSHSFVQPGVGGRVGAEIPFGAAFVARASVDALRLPYRAVIGVGGKILVDQPPVMLGAQITGEWKF